MIYSFLFLIALLGVMLLERLIRNRYWYSVSNAARSTAERKKLWPMFLVGMAYPFFILNMLRPFLPLIVASVFDHSGVWHSGISVILISYGVGLLVRTYLEMQGYLSGASHLYVIPTSDLLPKDSKIWGSTTTFGRARLSAATVFLGMFLKLPAASSAVSYGLTALSIPVLQTDSGYPVESSLDHAYFAFVSISTLGFGDIEPASSLGKVFVIAHVVMFVTAISVFMAMLATLLPRAEDCRLEHLSNDAGDRPKRRESPHDLRGDAATCASIHQPADNDKGKKD